MNHIPNVYKHIHRTRRPTLALLGEMMLEAGAYTRPLFGST